MFELAVRIWTGKKMLYPVLFSIRFNPDTRKGSVRTFEDNNRYESEDYMMITPFKGNIAPVFEKDIVVIKGRGRDSELRIVEFSQEDGFFAARSPINEFDVIKLTSKQDIEIWGNIYEDKDILDDYIKKEGKFIGRKDAGKFIEGGRENKKEEASVSNEKNNDSSIFPKSKKREIPQKNWGNKGAEIKPFKEIEKKENGRKKEFKKDLNRHNNEGNKKAVSFPEKRSDDLAAESLKINEKKNIEEDFFQKENMAKDESSNNELKKELIPDTYKEIFAEDSKDDVSAQETQNCIEDSSTKEEITPIAKVITEDPAASIEIKKIVKETNMSDKTVDKKEQEEKEETVLKERTDLSISTNSYEIKQDKKGEHESITEKKLNKVNIYFSSSCNQEKRCCKYAFMLEINGEEKEIFSSVIKKEHKEADLIGILYAFSKLPDNCVVSVFSDRQYLIMPFKEGWIFKWKQTNWCKDSSEKIKNSPLWNQTYDYYQKYHIKWYMDESDKLRKCQEEACSL